MVGFFSGLLGVQNKAKRLAAQGLEMMVEEEQRKAIEQILVLYNKGKSHPIGVINTWSPLDVSFFLQYQLQREPWSNFDPFPDVDGVSFTRPHWCIAVIYNRLQMALKYDKLDGPPPVRCHTLNVFKHMLNIPDNGNGNADFEEKIVRKFRPDSTIPPMSAHDVQDMLEKVWKARPNIELRDLKEEYSPDIEWARLR